ncbi:50S ribosomal protein L25 [Candidatus Azambacteria bacterium]|nr:50S ribosomal protein L25 [Candidatus Azambacteria bacterium]
MILEAQTREITGKAVKALREQGFIPAVLYGQNISNSNLLLDYQSFQKIYKQIGESTILELKIENDNTPKNILIHDITFDQITGKIKHVDLYQVKMDKKIKIKVPIEFVGESLAVKEGNILVKNLHEIELEVLPSNLPKSIIVDISNLNMIHDKILIADLSVLKNIKIVTEPSMVVAIIEELRAKEIISEKPVETTLADIKTVAVPLARG